MSVIGVGKAARDIDREGARARARRAERVEYRRQKTREADWVDERGDEATCTACGHDDDVASMFTASTGLVCATCFSADEGKIAGDPIPTMWQVVTRPVVYTPLLTPVLLAVWIESGGTVTWLADLVFMGWIFAFGGSMFWGLVLGLNVLESVRLTLRRSDLEPDERILVIADHIWHFVGLVGLALGGFYSATWYASLF